MTGQTTPTRCGEHPVSTVGLDPRPQRDGALTWIITRETVRTLAHG